MIRQAFAVAVAVAVLAGPALAEEWRKLVTPAQLEAIGEALVLDIRAPVSAEGRPGYDAGHIPGAVNAPYAKWRGPKENPGKVISDEALTALLQNAGVTRDRPVVVAHLGHNASDFGAAARVYWTLKSAGLEKIAILDGGTLGWFLSGRPLSTEPSSPAKSDIVAELSDEWRADTAAVRKIVEGDEAAVLLDARPEPFFKGDRKHGAAKMAGTIPGSQNLNNLSLFPGGGPVVGEAQPILDRLRDAGLADTGKPIVSFCNTGHWAATNWFFASEVAGLDDVKLYAESVVEWTQDDNEVVKGE